MQPASVASCHPGRIRNATLLDTRALSRLLPHGAASRHDPLSLLTHGHLLVLDLGHDSLGAAAHVEVVDNLATVDLLVVDPTLRGQHIAERMAGVAHALCEAHGYTIADAITASPASPRTSAPRQLAVWRGR